MKIDTLRGLIGLALLSTPLACTAQDDNVEPGFDEGPFFEEKVAAEVEGWTITSISLEGKFQHALMERGYDDGTYLRYFRGEKVSTFMFYDSSVFGVFTDDVYEAPISYSFSGGEGGDTDVKEAKAAVGDGLTNSQDAFIRTEVNEDATFLDHLSKAGSLKVTIRDFSRSFDLKGAGKAAEELLKLTSGSTAAGGEESPQMPAGARVMPAENADTLEGEKVVLTADTPSIVWDLSLNGGESKVYQIKGKIGQSMKLSFIEDTREGQMDLGRASVEEGLENGATIEFSEEKFQRVDVSNPSDKQMDFRIYLSIEE